MTENMENKNVQSDSEGEDEEETTLNSNSNSNSNSNLNSTQTNKDKKKKKKNKSKTNSKTQIKTQTKSQPQSAMAKLILERKRLQEKEDERVIKLQEEEDRKIKEEEERIAEIKKKEEEDKKRKRKAKQDKIQAQKLAGTYKTKSEKEKEKKNQHRLEQMKKQGIITEDGRIVMKRDNLFSNNKNILYTNESNEENEENKKNEDLESDTMSEIEIEIETETETETETEPETNVVSKFRCPLFTIMGHVDTGKTTLLDYLRNTSVQSHEVGGITQQIGSTLLTKDIILKQLKEIKNLNPVKIKVPGLLLVDTPGHEAFKGLRKLGSKLADIALVIIDIMHGLEPQTIESIKLLTVSGTPYMFVLNKIDRLYGWDKNISGSIDEIINGQELGTREQFDTKFKDIQTQIMMQGINNELVWLNTTPIDTINVVPLSAITGQGIPNLLNTVITYSQTVMAKQIEWVNKLECFVMEITNVEGYGYTLDCVLKNGQLTRGDIIKLQTHGDKTILTKVKNILTVPENKDSKSNSKYIPNHTIKESCGIKIVGSDFEKTLIGSKVELGIQEELDAYVNLETQNLKSSLDTTTDNISEQIKLDSQGIAIFTSSQGSLESFVEFVRSNMELTIQIPIQISYVSVGSVGKKDLTKFNLINSYNSSNVIPENNCVLAFEVEIEKEAQQYAKDNNIQIFEDKTIYRLFNQYREYTNKQYDERKEKARTNTVFPCILKIIESNVFNKKNPLVMGVEVIEGTLHLGTPLIILPSKTFIGNVVGIQVNKQDVKIGKKTQSVCVKIDNQQNPNIMYGRQFGGKDLLYSYLTRTSVDILKEYFKNDLSKDDIGLLLKLKKQIGF
jgi:translation initiation factor 5B